ncbi:MAG: DUF4202 domain-containing protein [Proteobacteria bacterium]|nr:DUF4202 domain-containing protein [Pseudomonadota bacterium]
MGDDERLRRALAAIDEANAGDPNRIEVRGASRPKEVAHAELVSEWVERLRPNASEALRLAARAHHVQRWTIPRSDHPEGRLGYHRWRTALQRFHAEKAGEILAGVGYDAATIERVQNLVQKRDLGRDPEVQALEDALCLVFLETQLRELAERLDEARLLDVLRKTLAKMSPAAIECAGALVLAPAARACLERAMES